MKKLIFLSLLFLLPATAFAKIFIKPFDSIGARSSGDITIPCDSGKILKSSGGGVWTCQDDGGTSTPSGDNTDIQFNDNSSFGGESGLTWNKATKVQSVSGDITLTTNPTPTTRVIQTDNQSVSNKAAATLSILTGDGNGTGKGGAINIIAGDNGASSTTFGANVNVTAGNAGDTNAGGDINLTSGIGGATSGNSGAISLIIPAPVAGDGSDFTFTGSSGVGTNKNGSDFSIVLGDNTGSGIPGKLSVEYDGINQTAVAKNMVFFEGTSATVVDGSTIADWNHVYLGGPSISGVAGGGTETVTRASTLYINQAPQNGGNLTLSNAYAIWVDDGTSRFDGTIATALTPSRCVETDGSGNLIVAAGVCGTPAASTTIGVSEDGTAVVSADTLNFTTGIKATTTAASKVTVSADIASNTSLGVASFDTATLGVTKGGLVTTRALKGPITSTSGDVTTTISNDAVTYAKIQNVTNTDRVLGRSTAAAGDVEEITFSDSAQDFSQDTFADDQVWVADSSTAGTARTLTNCTDTSGQHLNYTQASNSFSCGTTTSASTGIGSTVVVSDDGTGVVTSADTLNFTTAINAKASGNKAVISSDIASTSALGVASYDSTNFTVTPGGLVSISAGGSGSGWTDGGTLIRTTTTSDDVTVGPNNNLAKLTVSGDTNEIQLLVRGAVSQDANLIVAEQNTAAGTDLFSVSKDGAVVSASTGTFGGTDQSTISEGLVVNNANGTDEDDDFTVKASGGTYEVDAGAGTFIGSTNDAGWTVVDQTDNQACTTGCTSACLFGIANATGVAVTNIVSCSDTTADLCLCMGAS